MPRIAGLHKSRHFISEKRLTDALNRLGCVDTDMRKPGMSFWRTPEPHGIPFPVMDPDMPLASGKRAYSVDYARDLIAHVLTLIDGSPHDGASDPQSCDCHKSLIMNRVKKQRH
ncbi:hypothetical protein MTBLM5_10170 [Magnetospirillum sp. LM-5]|nr:hypothetical protein MTBLM5_10170 [Magnetospirillum sp. LM-5]